MSCWCVVALCSALFGGSPSTAAPIEEAGLVQAGEGGEPGKRTRRSRPHPEVGIGLLVLHGDADKEALAGLRSLLATVARRTSVETESRHIPVLRLGDAALFEHPLVFLAGSEPLPQLTDKDLDVLRSYLSLGGMVLVDDRSGVPDSAFAASVHREIARALGGRKPAPLGAEHAVYRSYYLLDRAWGRVDLARELEVVELDGRAAVLFSLNDLLGAMARDEFGQWSRPVTPGGRKQRERALRLGVNVVLYALTLDYKEDLVHLPHILDRRR
jgi:hypothetical protein